MCCVHGSPSLAVWLPRPPEPSLTPEPCWPRRWYPRGCRDPQVCSRTVCKPRGVSLVLVKTILKSHFPLIKYGFVLQMHA